VFVPGGGALEFAHIPPPEQEDVERLAERIAVRLGSIARRRIGDDERVVEDDDAAMFAAAAESLRLPGIRPREDEADSRRLCASVDGFTLHAGRHVEAGDREALERLLRYCLRPPFSAERFSLDGEGRVHYRLRKPWPGPHGSTDLVLDPLALLRRLASLVPRPYSNLVRYHGVFSNRSKHRPLLPRPDAPDPATPASDIAVPGVPEPDPPPRRHHLAWAKLLRRVLDIDALSCPKCATPMVVLAFITDPPTLRKILDHLGLPSSPPPVLPARRAWEEFPIEDQGGWQAEDQQSLPDLEGQLGNPPDSS